MMPLQTIRIVFLTLFALMAFAANSVLNRLALGANAIDAGSYIAIRLISGAITLAMLNGFAKRDWNLIKKAYSKADWQQFLPAFYLFLYGITFSFAYRSLNAGMGAFILFGTVQCTMLLTALLQGERPHLTEWLGLSLAISGLMYLVFPGLSAPDLLGAFLMLAAGIAWGFYTLKGKGVKDPLEMTALNFLRSVPFVLCMYIFTFHKSYYSVEGITYAIISGAITSGIGYAIWYAALRGLTTTQAALLQLCVPIIAAFGGILFLSEQVTVRLIGAGALILGGVLLAIFGKKMFVKS